MRSLRLLLACGLLTVGCQAPSPELENGEQDGGSVVPPELEAAVTSLTPPPGPFNGTVTVHLETDRPATIFVTTDGSDPRDASGPRITGPSPLVVELTATTTLMYYSRTPEGADEAVRVADYTRVGEASGSVQGVVVVGSLAAGKDLALSVDGALQPLGKLSAAGELPFSLIELSAGTHRLLAWADTNADGNFWPVVDLASEVVTVELDFGDPTRASATGVRLLLSASAPQLATISGRISLPTPPPFQGLTVTALSPDALGAGMDPNALLTQLRNGYQVLTNSKDTEYPYAITDLQPGSYVPVPALMGMSTAGAAVTLIANPFKIVNLGPGDEAIEDFAFGPVTLSGTLRYTPATSASGFTYGVIAAKNASLLGGMQVVLMPVLLFPTGMGTTLTGGYSGNALRANTTFQLKLFTSLDDPNPLGSALTWALTPFGSAPQVTVSTGTGAMKKDLTLP